MNYATIKYYDIANGPGVRTSVFVSGCRHHCPGCFNEVAWDFGYGQPFDKPVRNEVFASCKPDYITGLSLLGGEPMEPENQRELVTFVQNFKALYPKKTVWCYSGYTWETSPSASGAAGTSVCWMFPSPSPPGSRCGGRTKKYSPPIRWNDKQKAQIFHNEPLRSWKICAFSYSLLPTISSMARRNAMP